MARTRTIARSAAWGMGALMALGLQACGFAPSNQAADSLPVYYAQGNAPASQGAVVATQGVAPAPAKVSVPAAPAPAVAHGAAVAAVARVQPVRSNSVTPEALQNHLGQALVPMNAVNRADLLASASSKTPVAITAPKEGAKASMTGSAQTAAAHKAAPASSSAVVVPATALAASSKGSTNTSVNTNANAGAGASAEDYRLQAITPNLIASLKRAQPNVMHLAHKLSAGAAVYRVGAGDVLSIAVWGEPELSMATMTATTTASADGAGASSGGVGYLVSASGKIQFPYVGQVQVAGLTEGEIYHKLTADLGRYLRKPQLTVRVQNYRSQRVYIDGEVKTPGVYSVTDLPMTLPEALNRAGGALTTADLSHVQLNRKGTVYPINMSALVASGINPSDIVLQAGDMLRVPNRDESKVYVIGEVQKPSALTMNNGSLTLNAALGEAAGVSPVSGNAKQVYVVRTKPNAAAGSEPAVYYLDARAPAALILAEQFELQPHDVVYVDASSLATWNRVISLILPSAALLKTGQDFSNNAN